MNKNLIIIPGIGDRERLYATILPLWGRRGYDARVFNFGWNTVGNNFEDSLRKLEALIVGLSGSAALIGASAGGTAALHAGLRHPDKVTKIVAISTALMNPELAKSPMLRQSITELEPVLQNCDAGLLEEKVLSVYGLYDQRVAIRRSQHEGLPQLQLPLVGHGLIIATALTVLPFAGDMLE